METACNRTMFSSGFILYSLLVLTSCSEFHEKVFSNLLLLCPAQYVPTDNDTELNQTSEFDSCCTDPFSKVSFTNAEMKKTKYAPYGQTCLFPNTYTVLPRYQEERSYSMITDPPKEGCSLPDDDTETINGNSFNQPTCNDSDVIPFKRFLPVYAESTGLIYKSPHCASCHGQYNVTMWKAFAFCDSSNAFSYKQDDCDFQFVYPGNSDDINHLECFTDYYSACPAHADNLRIPAETNLTFNELKEACSMDNLPRFTHYRFAKNIFCFICHFCRNYCYLPARSCSHPVMQPPGKSKGQRFTRILDSSVISKLHTVEDTVCGLDQDEQVCLEILCPLGQAMIFDGLEMKCRMDSIQWQAPEFITFLLLEFDHSLDVHKNNLHAIFTSERTQSMWPRKWSIRTLYQPSLKNVDLVRVGRLLYNVSSKPLSVNSVNHVYVHLAYSQSTVNPVELHKDLEEMHMNSWSMTIDGKRYRVRQSLTQSTLQSMKAELSPGDTRALLISLRQHMPDVKPYDRMLYRAIVIYRTNRHAYILNKLMLCKQVELASSNFHVIANADLLLAIYHNRTGQYLFNNEFTNVPSQNGGQAFRVCVLDVWLKSNESVRLLISLKLLLLATVIISVL